MLEKEDDMSHVTKNKTLMAATVRFLSSGGVGVCIQILSMLLVSFVVGWISFGFCDNNELSKENDCHMEPVKIRKQAIVEDIKQNLMCDTHIEEAEKINIDNKREFDSLGGDGKDLNKVFVDLIERVIAHYDFNFSRKFKLTRQMNVENTVNRRFNLGDNSIDFGGLKITTILIIENVTKIELIFENGWRCWFSLCLSNKAELIKHNLDNEMIEESKAFNENPFWISSDILYKEDISDYLSECHGQDKGLSIAMCNDFLSSINSRLKLMSLELVDERFSMLASENINLDYEFVRSINDYFMGQDLWLQKTSHYLIFDWNSDCGNSMHRKCVTKCGIGMDEVFNDVGFRIVLKFREGKIPVFIDANLVSKRKKRMKEITMTKVAIPSVMAAVCCAGIIGCMENETSKVEPENVVAGTNSINVASASVSTLETASVSAEAGVVSKRIVPNIMEWLDSHRHDGCIDVSM